MLRFFFIPYREQMVLFPIRKIPAGEIENVRPSQSYRHCQCNIEMPGNKVAILSTVQVRSVCFVIHYWLLRHPRSQCDGYHKGQMHTPVYAIRFQQSCIECWHTNHSNDPGCNHDSISPGHEHDKE